MIKIIRNISLFIGIFLVLSLTIGTHVSKMKCDAGGMLYFGSEVPSCSLEEEMVCDLEQEKVSCCMLEIEKSCCPETNDKSCASETEILQFSFNTILNLAKLNFEITSNIIIFKYQYLNIITNSKLSSHNCGLSPPNFNKPILSQIQSFLL